MAYRIIRILALSILGVSLIALTLPMLYFSVSEGTKLSIQSESAQIVPGHDVPYRSFIQVLHSTYIEVGECMSDDIFCPVVKKTIVAKSKGSGVIVGHEKGYTYIISAQHVCEHRKAKGALIGKFAYEYEYDETVHVVTFEGDIVRAMVVSSDIKSDLCLMSFPKKAGETVQIRHEKIGIGDPITNIGAPLGIFTPGMALTFDGRYSGSDALGNSYFSFPGAPGSSGSPIIDSRGNLVSIVHSAHTEFSHLAIGCTQASIHSFLYKNRKYVGFLMKD